MKHESIGIPSILGAVIRKEPEVVQKPEWTGDRIQTNDKGQMRTNFVENEAASAIGQTINISRPQYLQFTPLGEHALAIERMNKMCQDQIDLYHSMLAQELSRLSPRW